MKIFDNWPFYFFSQRPLLIALVAVLISLAAWKGRQEGVAFGLLIVSAAAWWIYVAWEVWLLVWRSPTGDMAIRVDAVFLEPVMQILLVVNVVVALRELFAAPPP